MGVVFLIFFFLAGLRLVFVIIFCFLLLVFFEGTKPRFTFNVLCLMGSFFFFSVSSFTFRSL